MSSSSNLVISSNVSNAGPRQAKRKRLLKVCESQPPGFRRSILSSITKGMRALQ